MSNIWTKEKIEEALQEVIGKEISYYYEGEDVYKVISKIFNEVSEGASKLTWRSYRKEQYFTFMWAGYGIIDVLYKRKKGAPKEHYWQSQKYVFKSFEVSFYFKAPNYLFTYQTIEEAIIEAEKLKAEAEKEANILRTKAWEVYKFIYDKYGEKEAYYILECIRNNRYDFNKKLKGEE